MAVSMVMSMVLFFACVKVFVWMAGSLAQRQYNYDLTRSIAAGADDAFPAIPYEPLPLRVFEER